MVVIIAMVVGIVRIMVIVNRSGIGSGNNYYNTSCSSGNTNDNISNKKKRSLSLAKESTARKKAKINHCTCHLNLPSKKSSVGLPLMSCADNSYLPFAEQSFQNYWRLNTHETYNHGGCGNEVGSKINDDNESDDDI